MLYYLQLCTERGNGIRIPSQKQCDDKNESSFMCLSKGNVLAELQLYQHPSTRAYHPTEGLVLAEVEK